LQQNGYLDANGVPTSKFHDWLGESHSSLSQSNNPLQVIAGEYYFLPDGRITGPIHIMVRRDLRSSEEEIGSNGSGEPGGGRPVLTNAPVNEYDRNALLADLAARHKRWYEIYCKKLRSGCAIIPNGVRDELGNWIQKETRQQQMYGVRNCSIAMKVASCNVLKPSPCLIIV
jgi:hypothetical protein